MKKIIVNGRFLIHQITGVERYAREILLELDKIAAPGEIEMAVPPDATELPVYKNIEIIKVGRLNNRLWEHLSFPRYVKKKNGISLNLCNVAPLPEPGVVCLFDAKIKVHPEFFSKIFLLWYNLLFWNATKRARLILTDSEAAKKDLQKYYPFLAAHKIQVIYPGWQHYERINYNESTLEKYSLKRDHYYFAMGSLEPNKNFKWVAEAARRNPDQIFAVSGSVNKKIFADGLGFACPSNMRLLGYVSDEEAKTLMRDCKAFLFPTIYEGFGLPPLEALCAGARRIIVSDTDVMHEVFGGGAEYINPSSYEYNLEGQKEKISGERILNRFSWKRSAESLYKVLKEIGLQ